MENIGLLLKKARLQKGLSQKAVALMIGLQQSHLSKIENGLVDLQTSSLIQLSRALDLELMLIPRILVHTVEALQRGLNENTEEPRPMYELSKDEYEE